MPDKTLKEIEQEAIDSPITDLRAALEFEWYKKVESGAPKNFKELQIEAISNNISLEDDQLYNIYTSI